MSKTVFISACGSSIGLEVARSLRLANRSERLIGGEVSDWGIELGGRYCDEVIRLPRGDDPTYLPALSQAIHRFDVGLVYINTDVELETIADGDYDRPVPFTCPNNTALATCIDKAQLHAKLKGTGLVAQTRVIRDPDVDLEFALSEWGAPVWIRCGIGPRGKGSLPVTSPEDGAAWIAYWQNQTPDANIEWLVHEYLPGRNLNWTSIWNEGELVASATGERLEYFASQVAVSGVTGNVSYAQVVSAETVQDTAKRALAMAVDRPHGVFSVDLREDRSGAPRVTEFNGRQAFRPLLYTVAGANFSSCMADVFLDGQPTPLSEVDAASPGWQIRRGMDHEPLIRSGPSEQWRGFSSGT